MFVIFYGPILPYALPQWNGRDNDNAVYLYVTILT
jgi:hypothetical protein